MTNTNAARLLMSPMRDASNFGKQLRAAHNAAGMFLAVQFLADLLGVHEVRIPHAQGHATTGFRLADEDRTLIIALMRRGEPMALGFSDVFPTAAFLHTSTPEDIKDHHLENAKNGILVDSVDKGKAGKVVVVAGVVQEDAVAQGHAL
ncbi:hypothetical protein NLG97_g5340 [Lecanicillium saksenae]|uniref:Uncharacterized protein n=1 Tax=Lecanicillium saksenae TaxID=468837 RepID=A0ACC1QSP9_9HYPO|nr:hypothetical protein NLG97_g5340 [Lecanicillium saksenae]